MLRTGISNLIRKITILALLMFFLAGANMVSTAQSFDHEEHPRLDFDFQKLNLELGIQPQNLRIDGAAEYKIRANVSGADTLTLYASHLDIGSVTVNEKQADFSLHNDSLFIAVDDSAEAGTDYTVRIRYSGRPNFGMLKNVNGTVWTSQLPRAERHWVPIVDNPNVAFRTDFSISVPSGNQVWATGRKTGEEVISVEVMNYTFSSKKEVPASSLAFAIGNFKHISEMTDSTQVNLVVEKTLVETVESKNIIQYAKSRLSKVASRLSADYPFESLNIVFLDDHTWDTKSWASNTIFIYKNRGDWKSQLLRGITAQWFGVLHREEQWQQADAITLYQTLLMKEFSSDTLLMEKKDEPKHSFETIYDNYGPAEWNRWQQGIEKWQTSSIRNFITDSAVDILKLSSNTISWESYADYWYRKIGQPLYEMPQFSLKDRPNVDKQQSDSVRYNVFYTLNEAEGQLKLRFEAKKGVFKDLTTLEVQEVYPNKTDKAEVTFTGREDSVILQVDPVISNLKLDASNHPMLMLNEYKPVPFLLHQMKNGDTVKERADAAQKLGYHDENPDLQLAIQDFMNRGLEPQVRAALLHSMADITGGAAGTQQLFLDALDSENTEIRNAGLMALQNYKDNSSVRNRVESEARSASDLSYFKKATKVLMSVSSEDQFNSFVQSIAREDTVGIRSIFAIQELANMGNVEEAVERATLFISDEYRYNIRSRALGILIQHDHAPANWIARAEDLMSDPDPRIRFLVTEGMQKNSNKEILNFLKEHVQDEYDARVHRKIEQILK